FMINKILATVKLSLEDVSIIEIPHFLNINTALESGRISAMINIESAAQDILDREIGKLVFTSADFKGILPEGLVVQKRLLEGNPDVVKKFLHGWLAAVRWQADARNLDVWLNILNTSLLKDQPETVQGFAKLREGVRIHDNLDIISARNRDGLKKYIGELVQHLEQSGVKVKSQNPVTYMQTNTALEVAKEVFK
ncbi:MAG: ABC transporter substrate-binding protein, partial [Pseudomonadota bacterium]